MKRSLGLLLAVVMIGVSVGCGSKEKVLNCSKKEEESGISMKQNIKATFNGNDVKNVTVTVDAELGDEYKDYKSIFISSLESSFEDYKDLKGVSVDTSDKDDTITVTLKADLTKMDKDAKEKLDIVDTKASYKESKADLEKDGYTCK